VPILPKKSIPLPPSGLVLISLHFACFYQFIKLTVLNFTVPVEDIACDAVSLAIGKDG
jgi:hypothetical protein